MNPLGKQFSGMQTFRRIIHGRIEEPLYGIAHQSADYPTLYRLENIKYLASRRLFLSRYEMEHALYLECIKRKWKL